ncbi:hypothetical protein MM300_01615 [Evansella sp. LMS18]|uniref:hypothetical protein n=1 Tax=Evansella sp. LMS18 TaxID=2924033 RepID=UPI0020D1CAEE|nr:hypothetical protein [Evansella sp. LMS18]UTR11058.1 hypothetical protein MM300_01615 [Evansella sp. LMS18]
MSTEEFWFNIAQIVIMILGFLGVGFIPQFFYQKKISNLRAELNKLNITVEQNHPIKMEKYKNFVENFFENVKIKNESQKERKLEQNFRDISNAVFLFGSDETMKSFLVLREGTGPHPAEEENLKVLADAAKFMVNLRKDLNGGQTDIGPEDYLKLLLNDWKNSKEKISKYL